MPLPLRRLLLTGFEPFGEVRVNPSWECVKTLDGEVWGGRVLVRAVRLPVSYARGPARLAEEIEAFRPDAVVMFGVAQNRRAVSLERFASNRCDALPDNDGVARAGPIDPDGPPRRESTLPVPRMQSALERERVPAETSDDAGGYLCNRVFWEARATFAGPAGFVHVPPFEAIGEEALRRGVRAVAEAVAFEEVRLAVVQVAPEPLAVAANLVAIRAACEEARGAGARLVLFPELATCGLGIENPAKVALRIEGPELGAIRKWADGSGVAVALGFAESAGRAHFNAAALFFPGREPLVYRKRRLFGHDFQWASEGEGGGPWETPLGQIGIAICHDVVYSDIAGESRGCDLVLMPTNWIGDSGPGDYLAAFAAPVLAADRSGEEDGIRFLARGGLYAEGGLKEAAGEGVAVVSWKRVAI